MLLGERPDFVPTLLRTLLGMELPRNLVIVPAPETIRALRLPEHAADVVVASLSMPLTLESRTQKLMAMRNSRAIETEMRPIAAVHAAAPS